MRLRYFVMTMVMPVLVFMIFSTNAVQARTGEGKKTVEIQLIRNATMKISYAGKSILTDPMLSEKGAFMSFAGISKNPTVDLPCSASQVTAGVQAVLISHLHPDHLDQPAIDLLLSRAGEISVFCQAGDEETLLAKGLSGVRAVTDRVNWEGIEILRTQGLHGDHENALKLMGKVSGFVLRAPGQPLVYWAGDTILNDQVNESIDRYAPDILILHSGGAATDHYGTIIMDAGQTIDAVKRALQANPGVRVLAIHMESLDHCGVTRKELRRRAGEAGIPEETLLIPQDGETLNL